jgi:hypothetical protein
VPTSPFSVVVQFRIPAACTQPCKLKAKLYLRDGTTLLGARSALRVNGTGLVRIAIPIDRAVLASARSTRDAKGYSTTETRFLVSFQGGQRALASDRQAGPDRGRPRSHRVRKGASHTRARLRARAHDRAPAG